MRLSSWGRYPTAESRIHKPRHSDELVTLLQSHARAEYIPRGRGRSYGDSALAADILCTQACDHFIAFNSEAGLLQCAAGLTLEHLLRAMLPQGWFLPVVPGTCYVSVGGAIASDVHGKNHHLDGSFSEHVESLRLLLANGDILTCSASTNTALFHATCGGMGLTGIIIDATLRLRRVHSSAINQRTLRARNLDEIFEKISAHHSSRYSVAWLDCLAKDAALGRSLLLLGEHAEDERFAKLQQSTIHVPFATPACLLNRYSMRLFNTAYFHKPIDEGRERRIEARNYFFPLDSITHWNRLYGRRGFLQYQCVIPDDAALVGMRKILTVINKAGKGSFLTVLKKLGPANANLLAFPLQGYTLAMDFKYEASIFPLLNELDRIVLDHAGRLYLAKDARMSLETFRSSYPRWEDMQRIRAETGADQVFHSLQSRRLGF